MRRAPAFTNDELRAAPGAIFRVERVVAFQEVDAAGTVFFPRVLEYCSDAYIGLLCSRGVDLPRLIAERAYLAPLAHAEADYSGPMRFGDRVAVEVVASRPGSTSFALGFRVTAVPGGELCAVAHTVHVVVDPISFRPKELPAALREALRGG
jgi:acyl-CoA thioesterase FadM